jgi:acyl-CoA dehydrogenase
MKTDELDIFEKSVERFLKSHSSPELAARWREQGWVDREFWRLCGESGLLGLSVPEQYGGHGGDFWYDVVLMRQLVMHGLGGFAAALHNAVVAPYIVSYASEEQKHRWLPKVVSGEIVLAVAMTEPDVGSDLQSMRTTARRDGAGYRINGQKTFISNGYHAGLIVVACRTSADAGGKGISLFLLETEGATGFERGRVLHKLGQSSRDTTELFFNDVFVPEENVLGGKEGAGFGMLMEKLPQERLVVAWQAMAMMEAAILTTIEYTRQRRAFGKRIFDFQNTQFKLAECQTKATIARVFMDDCTNKLLAGTLDAATASMAKYWVTETQGEVIDECLQLHGGNGYMQEYAISEMYKDARGFRIYGGTSEIMKLIIARSL